MDGRTDAWRRLDFHKVSIDFAAASAGRCGFTHLASGQVACCRTDTRARASGSTTGWPPSARPVHCFASHRCTP